MMVVLLITKQDGHCMAAAAAAAATAIHKSTTSSSPPQPTLINTTAFPNVGYFDHVLVKLTQAEADKYGAKCLDGSVPALYYAPARGAENASNYVLYFKGGGKYPRGLL